MEFIANVTCCLNSKVGKVRCNTVLSSVPWVRCLALKASFQYHTFFFQMMWPCPVVCANLQNFPQIALTSLTAVCGLHMANSALNTCTYVYDNTYTEKSFSRPLGYTEKLSVLLIQSCCLLLIFLINLSINFYQ